MILTILTKIIAYSTQIASCSNNFRIPVVTLRKGSDAISTILCAGNSVRKLNFSFKPIQKSCSYQLEAKQLPVNSWIIYVSHQKQRKYTAHKEMTPSEFCQFNDLIKNILHFMYGLNLHVYFLSYVCIMPLILLKNHLQSEVFTHYFKKCCRNTIEHNLFKCYSYNNLKTMEHVV